MKSINRATIVGALGQDPDIRYTQSGTAVTTFSVATNTRKKDQSGDYKDVPQWHNCVAFGKLGEIASNYLRKGSKIYCEGEIEYQQWEHQGETKKATKIVLRELSMLSSKNESGDTHKSTETSSNELHDPIDDDSIPF